MIAVAPHGPMNLIHILRRQKAMRRIQEKDRIFL